MKTKNIAICPSALSILCIKNKEKRQREWNKLIKSVYGKVK